MKNYTEMSKSELMGLIVDILEYEDDVDNLNLSPEDQKIFDYYEKKFGQIWLCGICCFPIMDYDDFVNWSSPKGEDYVLHKDCVYERNNPGDY